MIQSSLPLAAGYILVLLRCAGLFSVAPLYGLHTVPARVRLSVAFGVSVAAFMGAGSPSFAAWQRADTFMLAAASEALLGLSAGLASRFAIDAAGAAGHAMAMSMGLGFGSVIDPVHGAETTAVSELLTFLALGFAVAAGVHREAVAWLCRSLVDSPPGFPVDLGELASRMVAHAAGAAALAVRLAYPVLAAVTIGYLCMGLISRATPQLGLSNLGFAIALLAGGAAFYLVAPTAALMAAQAARAAFVNR